MASHVSTHTREPRSPSDDSNAWALAMYLQLRRRAGNLFFSPFSIRTALCMAHAGARGETAAQMRGALRISPSDESLQSSFAETVQRLSSMRGGQYEIVFANSLWAQEGAPLLGEYLDLIVRRYGGAMSLVDFRRAAEAARLAINQWVEERTRQRIRELIPSGGLQPETRLVLVNAIYFKGIWELPFHEAVTREEPFFLESGRTVQVPLMRRSGDIRYVQAGGYQAVELVYRSGELSMLVLLPDRNDKLGDLEETLSAQLLHACRAEMRPREIDLFLPRFKIIWGAALQSELIALGMPLAFTRAQADFSGINGHEPPDDESLHISAVFHEAFIDVGEEGTEAAAATAACVELTMALEAPEPAPLPVFRADHPFLFAIFDRKSGSILFLGRIADPTPQD